MLGISTALTHTLHCGHVIVCCRSLATAPRLTITLKELQQHNPLQLPRLPVPKLQDSVDRYLTSLQAVVSPQDLKEQHKLCSDFVKGAGNELQTAVSKSQRCRNRRT